MLYDPNGRLKEQIELKGIEINEIKEGEIVIVETANSTYALERIAGDRRVKIQGGKHFTDPTEAVMIGSTFGGSLMKLGWIGYKMHMEIAFDDKIIVTSPISKAKVKGDFWEYQMDWPVQP